MSSQGKLVKIIEKLLPSDINSEISARSQQVLEVRIHDNSIGQISQRHEVVIQVRVEESGRVGVGISNSLKLPALREAVAMARANAASGRPGPLILTGSTGHREMSLLDPETAKQKPADLAARLEQIGSIANAISLRVNGSLTAEWGEYALVNSVGLTADTSVSAAQFQVGVIGSDGTGGGYGYHCHRSIDELDIMGAFLGAAAKCQASQNPQSILSGEYTVILEQAAVADIMGLLAKSVFSGHALKNRRSPILTTGEKIFGDNITIWDDGLDTRGMAIPLDFQGVPKQRLNLVTKGVLNYIALDNETALDLDLPGTGHAPPPGTGTGPIPGHIFMEPGNAMLDDMIASTKNGILISRFSDLTGLDARSCLVTGTTGNGTLLIENGKLVSGLPNLRFTQNLILALNRVEMIGDEPKLFGNLWGGIRVPALKIHSFPVRGSNIGQV